MVPLFLTHNFLQLDCGAMSIVQDKILNFPDKLTSNGQGFSIQCVMPNCDSGERQMRIIVVNVTNRLGIDIRKHIATNPIKLGDAFSFLIQLPNQLIFKMI